MDSYPSPAMHEQTERTRSGIAHARFKEITQQLNQKLAAKKIRVVLNISLDSSEHVGNDDLVIAPRTTVAPSMRANCQVAVGQLELPYGN